MSDNKNNNKVRISGFASIYKTKSGKEAIRKFGERYQLTVMARGLGVIWLQFTADKIGNMLDLIVGNTVYFDGEAQSRRTDKDGVTSYWNYIWCDELIYETDKVEEKKLEVEKIATEKQIELLKAKLDKLS